MSVARTALGAIETVAADLRSRLNSLNGLNPAAIDTVAAEAREALTRVAQLLNSQAAGDVPFAVETRLTAITRQDLTQRGLREQRRC